MNNQIPILGVRVTSKNNNEIFDTIKGFIQNPYFQYIVTPNPEIILKAQNNENYWRILDQADLSVPDGVGLQYASIFLNYKKIHRFQGVELTKYILDILEQKKYSLYILALKGGLSNSEKIKCYFTKTYPNIKLHVIEINKSSINYENLYTQLNNIKPHILFSCIGAPLQEIIIHNIKNNTKDIQLAIANGASIDFIIGTQKRAPKFIQNIGLEWLWRLLLQPFTDPKGFFKRLKRIYNAVIKFPIKVIIWKCRSIFVYRKCVINCILNNKNQILITYLKQLNEWSIPQGGVLKSETIIDTAKREIFEELNIAPKYLTIQRTKNNIFKYKWNKSYKLLRGYKGQRQYLAIFKFTGQNNNIKPDNYEVSKFKWVDINKVIEQIYPIRQESAKRVINCLNLDLHD